jgi:rhodanese-related sulfurtransferase
MTKNISREELSAALDAKESIYLVEALPEKYFKDSHLPGAVQINTGEVDIKAAKLLPNKAEKIVVYCSNTSCNNSSQVAQRLAELGYLNVYKYAEGKQDWTAHGLPLNAST